MPSALVTKPSPLRLVASTPVSAAEGHHARAPSKEDLIAGLIRTEKNLTEQRSPERELYGCMVRNIRTSFRHTGVFHDCAQSRTREDSPELFLHGVGNTGLGSLIEQAKNIGHSKKTDAPTRDSQDLFYRARFIRGVEDYRMAHHKMIEAASAGDANRVAEVEDVLNGSVVKIIRAGEELAFAM